MCDAGFETSGTEGAAEIHVVTGLDTKPVEFSDFNLMIGRRFKNQGIGAG